MTTNVTIPIVFVSQPLVCLPMIFLLFVMRRIIPISGTAIMPLSTAVWRHLHQLTDVLSHMTQLEGIIERVAEHPVDLLNRRWRTLLTPFDVIESSQMPGGQLLEFD